jgi:hypothetical protein
MQYKKHLGHLCAAVGVIAAGGTQSALADSKPNTFEIYGFAQADLIYDGNRVDPAWQDALRPSKIPVDPGTFGSNGVTSFSIKQSRLGVKGDVPVSETLGDITFKFEFDLFGVGADAGQTTIRFRHIYGEWGPLLAGQTNSLFMDIGIFPNVIDYWGPAGMVFLRNPQIRLTPWKTEDSHFSVALEKSGNDVDPGQLREVDPDFGANVQSRSILPDLTAQFYTSGSWGHVQIAGIARDLGFETLHAFENRPKGNQAGWGVDLTAGISTWEKDQIIAGVVYGHGIANYMNDGGIDLAAGGTPTDPHAVAIPLLGVSVYYDHYWDSSWSTSLGYSFTQIDNTTLQAGDAFHKGEYASINLLWSPAPNLLIGGEGLWGQRTDHDKNAGQDLRFQFSVKYSFGTKIET